MSLHSQHYPMSSSFDDKTMVCVCTQVESSGMDWHREGWTGEAIV